MSSDVKPYLDSLTIRGLIVVVLGFLASHFGVDVAPEAVADKAIDVAAAVMQVVGIVVAAYGRVRADKPLG
jgi:Mg2+ and Co2+ transporter CorA